MCGVLVGDVVPNEALCFETDVAWPTEEPRTAWSLGPERLPPNHFWARIMTAGCRGRRAAFEPLPFLPYLPVGAVGP
jgi:hypothetical protein